MPHKSEAEVITRRRALLLLALKIKFSSTRVHENVSANQCKLGEKVSEVLCMNLKYPKIVIKIKNITV